MSVDITVTDSGVVLTVSPSGGGVVGVGIPAGGTTGQVLTKVSNTNYDVAWSAATLSNSLNAIAVNVSVSTSWVTVVSASVTPGTWLTTATLTVTSVNNQRTMQFRLYDSVTDTVIATTSAHLEHLGEPHNICLSALATITDIQSLDIQAKMVTGTGTILASSEGFQATSSNLSVVKVS